MEKKHIRINWQKHFKYNWESSYDLDRDMSELADEPPLGMIPKEHWNKGEWPGVIEINFVYKPYEDEDGKL